MKKAVIVLIALVVPAALWGMDINQGKFELSGQTAFNFSDTTTEVAGSPDIDETSWSIQLDGNYYVINNLGLGLILQYESSETEVVGGDIDSSTLVIGPQVTYNISLSPQASVFVNGAIGYATVEVENEDADGYAWQIGVGLKYFLTNSVAANGVVSYQSLSLEDDDGNDFDRDGVNVGVGLSVYF